MHSEQTIDQPITSFRIYGERCSGTNFVRALIERNIPALSFGNSYNWEKHNFINVAYALETEIAIVVVRNALTLLQSIRRNPHQVAPWYKTAYFSTFLQHEWSGIFNGELIEGQRHLDIKHKELMFERHPVTGQRIANVVQLRNLKVQSQLKVLTLFPTWMIVRYEDVRDAPSDFIANLARLTRQRASVDLGPVPENMSQLSGSGRNHLPYSEFSADDLRFVGRELDLVQEMAIGFSYPELTDAL